MANCGSQPVKPVPIVEHSNLKTTPPGLFDIKDPKPMRYPSLPFYQNLMNHLQLAAKSKAQRLHVHWKMNLFRSRSLQTDK